MTPTDLPQLDGPRVRLRPHGLTDLSASADMWAAPEVTRFITGRPGTPEEAWGRLCRYAGHWSLLRFGYFAVIERETGTFLGEVGLADFRRPLPERFTSAPEAGWAFLPAAQRQGFAAEALGALFAWADGRFGRTVCMIHPDNNRSFALASRLGFREFERGVYQERPSVLLERLKA